MREFRPKPFRLKPFGSEQQKNKHGLTDEQDKAMNAEFDRRVMDFREKWRLCPDRKCRRRRRCHGHPFDCNRKSWMRPWTNREYRRLRRDIVREPPRV